MSFDCSRGKDAGLKLAKQAISQIENGVTTRKTNSWNAVFL